MIITYLQTTNDSQAQMFINKDNSYVDLCSSVIPFDKRDKLFNISPNKAKENIKIDSSKYLHVRSKPN